MATYRKRMVLIASLSVLAGVSSGCSGPTSSPPPALPTTNEWQDPAEQPLPRPQEALAYLKAALGDDTRLIEVFNDRGMDGALDNSGRGKLRREAPKWWKDVEVISSAPKPREAPFRVTPDLGINIYAPGSAPATHSKDALPMGRPELRIMIYKARQLSRVVIADPAAGRLKDAVYIIHSTEPMDWVNLLFAGKL